MKVAFRADASLAMGTGHVMRCLTLAAELSRRGAKCLFICREHPGHMGGRIRDAGFDCCLLPAPMDGFDPEAGPHHAAWAGVPWQEDVDQTAAILGEFTPDWLILDHYAFDARWEDAARPAGAKLMVIDDLADRAHSADLLLDQNLGREATDYDGLVPDRCIRLIGPHHALLRPEFAATRAVALAVRGTRAPRHILISMGGVDADDVTSWVLRALAQADLPEGARATVILGAAAPARAAVEGLATEMPFPCTVVSQVEAMHTAMAKADIAIGAAGGTAWERCCLGLPAIVIPIAQNQRPGATALERAGAARVVEPEADGFASRLSKAVYNFLEPMQYMAAYKACARICDGKGAPRVLSEMNAVWPDEDRHSLSVS